jgi:hypothetical protein
MPQQRGTVAFRPSDSRSSAQIRSDSVTYPATPTTIGSQIHGARRTIYFTLSRPHDYSSAVRIKSTKRHARLANLGRRRQIQRPQTVVFPVPWFSLSVAARPRRKPQLRRDESPVMTHLNLIRPVLHVIVMKAGTCEEFIPRIVGAEELSTATASFW